MKFLSIASLLTVGTVLFLFTTANSQSIKNTTMDTQSKAPVQPQGTVTKTEQEWKEQLTPAQFRIARKHGTEAPNDNVYKEFKQQGDGSYYCVCCGSHLFDSETKFDSGSGWPSFYKPANEKNIKTTDDFSAGLKRSEVLCNTCDAHLGHVFGGEGYNTPTDLRYCINGTVLTFVGETK